MADRYAYIPLIGIFLMMVWGFADLSPATQLSAVPSAMVIGLLSTATYRQIGYWSNSYDLGSHALAVTQNNSCASRG